MALLYETFPASKSMLTVNDERSGQFHITLRSERERGGSGGTLGRRKSDHCDIGVLFSSIRLIQLSIHVLPNSM